MDQNAWLVGKCCIGSAQFDRYFNFNYLYICKSEIKTLLTAFGQHRSFENCKISLNYYKTVTPSCKNMSNAGTRDNLLSIVDDIEVIAKELFESLIAPKGQKLTAGELAQLAELLVAKDQDLKATLATAADQAEIQKKIDALQAEVEKQDNDIHHLQKYLKEAEHLLATAVYQARQKLQCIAKSNEKSVSVDEIIKYAHRISCSYAVAAPHNWQPGDPRRPYPTDIEMRLGFLGRLSDLPISGNMLQQQQGNMDMAVARGAHGEQNPSNPAGTFTWSASADLKNSMSSASNHGVGMDAKSHGKENEDVEVMSTDSSSSSSSDSQ